jgi:hypothetical protein
VLAISRDIQLLPVEEKSQGIVVFQEQLHFSGAKPRGGLNRCSAHTEVHFFHIKKGHKSP